MKEIKPIWDQKLQCSYYWDRAVPDDCYSGHHCVLPKDHEGKHMCGCGLYLEEL